MPTAADGFLVAPWCFRTLGKGTLTALTAIAGGQMSSLFRYEADAGGSFAVKLRAENKLRIRRCLELQAVAAAAGFPCAVPVTGAESLRPGLVISAESWRPGGEMQGADDDSFVQRSAALLAELVSTLAPQRTAGLHPPPPWMHWNPPSGAVWAPGGAVDAMDQGLVPDHVHRIARLVSARLAQSALPDVVGHGDWESQNLRWNGVRPWAVHDWDSLVALPEAAIAGAASGAFASTAVPTLAPVESSDEFLDSYEESRGKAFSEEEREVAWAASLWPALHNARGESLFQSTPVALTALARQARERLRRAGTAATGRS